MKRAFLFGDSTVFAGWGGERSVPHELARQHRLRRAPGLRVEVHAAPGWTTEDGLAYVTEELRPRLKRGDWVALSFGINDGTMGTARSYQPGWLRTQDIRRSRDDSQSPDSFAPLVSVERYRANLRAILQGISARGARAVLLVPRTPRWLPTGQGMPCNQWFWPASVPKPRERRTPLDCAFDGGLELALHGESIQARALLDTIRTQTDDSRALCAVAHNQAILALAVGQSAVADQQLQRALDKHGPHPRLFSLLSRARGAAGQSAEGSLTMAIDTDYGLPRLRSPYREAARTVSHEMGVQTIEMSALLSPLEVLDHCHVTEAGASTLAQSMLETFLTGASDHTQGTLDLRIFNPRVDYAAAAGTLGEALGAADDSRVPLSEHSTADVRRLLRHPGLCGPEELPEALPGYVLRYPEALWGAMFNPLLADLVKEGDLPEGLARWSPRLRDDAGLWQPEGPMGLRVAPPSGAAALSAQLLTCLPEFRQALTCFASRAATIRKWYFREALFDTPLSTSDAYLDRLSVRCFVEASARLAVVTRECASPTRGAVSSFVLAVANAIEGAKQQATKTLQERLEGSNAAEMLESPPSAYASLAPEELTEAASRLRDTLGVGTTPVLHTEGQHLPSAMLHATTRRDSSRGNFANRSQPEGPRPDDMYTFY